MENVTVLLQNYTPFQRIKKLFNYCCHQCQSAMQIQTHFISQLTISYQDFDLP